MASHLPTRKATPLSIAVFDGARLVGARQFDRPAEARELLENVRGGGLRALPLSPGAQAVWSARHEQVDAA